MVRKRRGWGESKERLLKALKGARSPLSPRQIARRAHLNRDSVRRMVQELAKEGKLSKPKRGLYALP